MESIETVAASNVRSHIYNLWQTNEFKKISQKNPFFLSLFNELEKMPLFFYDTTHPQGRMHLTSIFRCVARRQYSNEYIQDLYYLHELTHCAHFGINYGQVRNYQDWSTLLDNNELFSSLVSEAFIYFLIPDLNLKTFNPLWASRFLNQNENFDSLDFFKEFPFSKSPVLTQIIHRRLHLRSNLSDSESNSLDQAEKIIFDYNKPRRVWLQKWQAHYTQILNLLAMLESNSITAETFIETIKNNCDNFGRPFYPK